MILGIVRSVFTLWKLCRKTNRARKLAGKLVSLIPDLCGGDIVSILGTMPKYEMYRDGPGCDMVRKVG